MDKLGDGGIFTLKQLVETDYRKLSGEINVDAGLLRDLSEKAQAILGS